MITKPWSDIKQPFTENPSLTIRKDKSSTATWYRGLIIHLSIYKLEDPNQTLVLINKRKSRDGDLAPCLLLAGR